MNRFVAYLLLTAFLQLQCATCCHCSQGLLGESKCESPAACGLTNQTLHAHDLDHHCPLHDSKDDDASPLSPPCGPQHGGHLCVISHLRFINSSSPYDFHLLDTVLNVDGPLLALEGISTTLDGNVANVSDSTTTLLSCHTLLRI